MAEENFHDRTEQATPRRREKAREEGQVARSLDLNSAFVILLGFSSLLILGPYLVQQTQQFLRYMLGNAPSIAASDPTFMKLFGDAMLKFFVILAPVAIALFIIGATVSVAQVGFHISTKALEPKLDKFDLAAGFKRLVGLRSLVSMIRDAVKLLVLGFVSYKVISGEADKFYLLSDMAIPQMAATICKLAVIIAVKIGAAMLFVAALDYMYQRWEFEKNIRMSRQDIKDEFKDTEGSPQVKARIRQIQREMARKRMMQDVPTADVVITNPTHLAVALKYDADKMNAPFVVAKGERLIAERIKQIAHEYDIPVIEDVQLARALFKMCEIGQMVPHSLYRAVAEVLAYVYRLKGKVLS
ncbi:MAG TPA: flagellar biosynthesis protein FlhB [Candidatus Acidoferrum sp.]|nr:flagellar biosynthesis protein FlhB [Candidatus Acidoferrum sp.]